MNFWRGSGTNAVDAAADCMWGATRQGNFVTTTLHVMKDGEDGAEWGMSLYPMEIGRDKNGKKIMSCSLEVVSEPETPTGAEHAGKTKGKRRDNQTELAWRFLNEALAEFRTIPPANARIPRDTRVVTVDQWRHFCDQKGLSSSDEKDSQNAAFRRAKDALQVVVQLAFGRLRYGRHDKNDDGRDDNRKTCRADKTTRHSPLIGGMSVVSVVVAVVE